MVKIKKYPALQCIVVTALHYDQNELQKVNDIINLALSTAGYQITAEAKEIK